MKLTENMNELHDVFETLQDLVTVVTRIRDTQHEIEDTVETTLGDDPYTLEIEGITDDVDDVHRHLWLAYRCARRALIIWDNMEEEDQ